jgi:hypothetical protein
MLLQCFSATKSKKKHVEVYARACTSQVPDLVFGKQSEHENNKGGKLKLFAEHNKGILSYSPKTKRAQGYPGD